MIRVIVVVVVMTASARPPIRPARRMNELHTDTHSTLSTLKHKTPPQYHPNQPQSHTNTTGTLKYTKIHTSSPLPQ